MVPTLENGLVKLQLRPKERVPEGRSEELVYEEPASEERSIKMVVPPKEMVSTAAKNPVRLLCWKGVWSNSTYARNKSSLKDPPKSSSPKKAPRMVALPKKRVNAAVNAVRLKKTSLKDPPKNSSRNKAPSMVALPKKRVNAAVYAVRLKKTSRKDPPKSSSPKKAPRMVALPKNMCSEPRLPNLLEKSLVKLHLGPKERVSEQCFEDLVSEENSEDGGAYEEKREPRRELRPPQVHIVNENDPTVSFLERAILPVLILFYAPAIHARAIRLEDEPEVVHKLYHWSGVVTLIGVMLVLPALVMGYISLRKGEGGRRAHEAEEGRADRMLEIIAERD